jgi:hypothetical protein
MFIIVKFIFKGVSASSHNYRITYHENMVFGFSFQVVIWLKREGSSSLVGPEQSEPQP